MLRERLLLLLLGCGLLSVVGGCQLVIPEKTHQPVIRNPFPQLSRVAIAPFFNQSDEPTLDGRAVAMAYFSELQSTPGFEVVPVGVVEEAMIAHQIDLGGPGEARRLATILEVDVVVVGSITDYTPYYPPRCGLRVEWYTANSGYHEIPAGYGLPWNTPEEEFIPDSLVYESQLALARSQMQALAPNCDLQSQPLPSPPPSESQEADDSGASADMTAIDPFDPGGPLDSGGPLDFGGAVQQAQYQQLPPDASGVDATAVSAPIDATQPGVLINPMPVDCATDEELLSHFYGNAGNDCLPYHGPVLRHTNIYRASDPGFSEALQGYAFFKNDHRIGGWRSYLNRSDDFIRVCCHLHISEMLSARGGSRKTRVVRRWPESR